MAIMETMLPSLRFVKTNDDGSPDPFVAERVELGPPPVREKLPATQYEFSASAAPLRL